jgi:signal transduction histidine kinase
MKMAQFIVSNSERIISEWEEFARSGVPSASEMDREQRRDHLAGMLHAVALDLDTPQTRREQAEKAQGMADADVESRTAANSHGIDRAVSGYTPMEVVSEFRALRASILRLWSEEPHELTRVDLEEVTRFNEAIDQMVAESVARYTKTVESSKEIFLGVLGHDLRNPLGAIMMSATTMVAKEGPEWPHFKAASRILNSATRMAGMIGDLLDFARARLGSGIPLVRKDMDLEAACRHTIDEVTAFHPGCVVQLRASGSLRGHWDGDRIAQLLSNLISNAHQYGSDNVPIEITLRGERDRVVLIVHNQGPAIAKDRLQDIFNPFQRLEPARARPGDGRNVGLGLYIVEAIVTAHQGTIDVESTERGTTFTVYLPRSPR